MRKIITTTFVTLDGVMQAPGGPTEDTSGGFAYGGWQMSFPKDKMLNSILNEFFGMQFELLLGKTTYDIFAAYWPHATTDLEVAAPFNSTKNMWSRMNLLNLLGTTQSALLAMWWHNSKHLKNKTVQTCGSGAVAISSRLCSKII